MADFSWNPEHNKHLTMQDVQRCLGAQFVTEFLLRQPQPAAEARCRAAGAWQANNRQDFAIYTRFVELYEAGLAK